MWQGLNKNYTLNLLCFAQQFLLYALHNNLFFLKRKHIARLDIPVYRNEYYIIWASLKKSGKCLICIYAEYYPSHRKGLKLCPSEFYLLQTLGLKIMSILQASVGKFGWFLPQDIDWNIPTTWRWDQGDKQSNHNECGGGGKTILIWTSNYEYIMYEQLSKDRD